jgi:hypothetical protein
MPAPVRAAGKQERAGAEEAAGGEARGREPAAQPASRGVAAPAK